MNDKDRADIFMRNAELFQAKFNSRQAIEWRVAIGYWGFLAAATVYLSEHREILVECKRTLVILLAWTSGAAFHFLWLRGIWLALESDKKLVWHFSVAAENMAKGVTSIPDRPPKHKFALYEFLTHWAHCVQGMTTVLLLFSILV